MNKMIKKIIGILTLAVVFVTPVFAGQGVSAASTEEVYEKILVNNIKSCYNNALISDIQFRQYNGFDSLMNSGYKKDLGAVTNNSFYVPSIRDSYNQTVKSDEDSNGGRRISCYEAFAGRGNVGGKTVKGLLDIYGSGNVPENHGDAGKLTSFMTDELNYSIVAGGNNNGRDYCYTVYLQETVAKTVALGQTCISQDRYPLGAFSGEISFSGSGESKYVVTGGLKMSGNEDEPRYDFSVTVTKNDGTRNCYDEDGNDIKCSTTMDLGTGAPTLGEKEMSKANWPNMPRIYVAITDEEGGAVSEDNSFKKDKSAEEFVKKLTGKEIGDFTISEADKYSLYVAYLKEYFGTDEASLNGGSCQADKPAQLVNTADNKYYVFVNGSGWCLAGIDPSNVNKTANMTIFSKGGNTLDKVITTLPQLIEAMGELDYTDASMFPNIDQTSADSQTEEELDECFRGAGALGWILCPVLQGLSELGAKMYNWVADNFLEVKAEQIFKDNGSKVGEAWSTIRDITNVAFVIMLLVVILSQVTGVGIDNYGIKRILPKIIIGAVLMNLSYIICELAVDVSNIFGSQLEQLLTNLGGTGTAAIASYKDAGGAYALSFGTVGGGIIAGAIGLIMSNGFLGALLMLLMALVTCVISILVLFIILVARQAGIVICVVIAPIAILCYLLPNTEKFFKKWLELMKGLLLVYPICGAMVGAGNFIGRIFSSLAVSDSGDTQVGFALGAMIVQVIPFLLIPTILRSSLAAMGNLGAKISGFGSRISGGANKRIRGSEAMKNSRELADERRTRFRAGIGSDGKPIKNISSFGKFMRGGKRGMARAPNQYLKDETMRRRGENLLNGVGLEAAIIGQQKQAEKNEMLDYMTLINNETRNGEDDKKLNELYDTYMRDGNKAGAVAVARIAGRRKDTASSFMKRNVVEGDAASKYDPKLMSSVMKEIATGENSGMYRSSNPLGFEFAAQYNRNYKEQYGAGDVRPEVKYSAWRNKENVSQALNNYVTNSQELVGMKNSSLEEVNKLIADGMVDETVARRIKQLANETIDNRGKTGVWDSTKADNIYAMAGRAVGDDRRNGGDSGTIQIVSEGGFDNAMNGLRDERGGLASGQQSNNPNNQPNNNSNNSDGSIIIPGRR